MAISPVPAPLLRNLTRAARLSATAALALAVPLATAQVDVKVSGLEGDLARNVDQRLSIKLQAKAKDLDQGLVEAMHRGAEDDINGALQPYGYYNPVVTAELSGKAPQWTARYIVNPGPRTTLRNIDIRIDGEGAEVLSEVRDAMLRKLRSDAPLLHADYEAAKSGLASAAYALGYLDAQYVRAELRIYADQNRADVVLHYDTGPRYRFGAVEVQQDIVDPDMIARYITIRPGTTFDPQALLDSQFNLTDLGYFDSIDMMTQKADTPDGPAVAITIKTTPRKRTRYDFGVGYGTDTGARVTAGTAVRRLNRQGHTLTLETRLSEIDQSASGEYRIPLGSRPGESIGVAGELTEEDLDSGFSRKYGIELSLSRIPGDWKRRIYLAYAHEESVLGETRQTSDLLMPGLSLNRIETDDPIYTRRGWSIFTDVHGGVRDIISNTSFVRSQVLLRGALPLGERARLLGRYEFGSTWAESFEELPASQRFFAGGDQSVRGYKYETLGPTDSDGNVIGGKYLTTFSIEAEYRLWESWGVAAFFDAGGADNDPTPELYRGIGAGVRYRAPIGSIQLDLAHPMDDPGGGVRLHLGVRVGL